MLSNNKTLKNPPTSSPHLVHHLITLPPSVRHPPSATHCPPPTSLLTSPSHLVLLPHHLSSTLLFPLHIKSLIIQCKKSTQKRKVYEKTAIDEQKNAEVAEEMSKMHRIRV
ncbi:hypothetical protein Hdeb2414_s0025g00663971 [Helianthus debilis subsp. tardiflorus]